MVLPLRLSRVATSAVLCPRVVASAVHGVLDQRCSKHPQRQGTPQGAQLRLHLRPRVSNDELADTFQAWYPDFHAQAPSLAA